MTTTTITTFLIIFIELLQVYLGPEEHWGWFATLISNELTISSH